MLQGLKCVLADDRVNLTAHGHTDTVWHCVTKTRSKPTTQCGIIPEKNTLRKPIKTTFHRSINSLCRRLSWRRYYQQIVISIHSPNRVPARRKSDQLFSALEAKQFPGPELCIACVIWRERLKNLSGVYEVNPMTTYFYIILIYSVCCFKR